MGIIRTIAMSLQHTVTEWPLHLWDMEGLTWPGGKAWHLCRERHPMAWGIGEACEMALGGTRKVGTQVLKAEKLLEGGIS